MDSAPFLFPMSDKNKTFTNSRDTLAVSMAPVSEVTGRKWGVTIIGPAKKSDLVTIDGQDWIKTENNRYYSVDALRRAFEAGMFEDAPVFDNHLTDEEWDKRGTMRSKDDWLASLVDTRWDRKANEGVAVMKVVDDKFAEKLVRAFEQKVLHTVGLSQDVMRDGFEKVIDGQQAEFVTRITKVNSVDAVMNPAGGGVYQRALEAIRSTEAMTPEQLAKWKEAIGAEGSGLSDEQKSQMLAILEQAAAEEPASEQDEMPEATVAEVVEEIEAVEEVVADAELPQEVAAVVIDTLEEAKAEVEAVAEEPERVSEARRKFAGVKRVAEAIVKDHKASLLKAKIAKATQKPKPVAAASERGTESSNGAVSAAEKILQEAQVKLDRASKIADDMVEAATLTERRSYLTEHLRGSGLPEPVAKPIAERFDGKTYSNAELKRAIESSRKMVIALDGDDGNVRSHGYASNIQVGRVTEADRYQLNFIRKILGPTRFSMLINMLHDKDKTDRPIFGALRKSGQLRAFEAWEKDGKDYSDLPSLSGGLREWYVSLTGDSMGVGEFHDRRGVEANITTSTVSSIVKNAVNLLLVFEYSQKDQWWSDIVFEEDVDTIDDATLIRLFAASTLPIISEGAVYTELDFEDEEETAIFVKRGGYIGVTLETFLRDKVSGLRNIAPRLADSWYSTVGSKVAAVFTTNTAAGPVLADTGALFNATAATSATGHANLLTAALTPAALTAVVTAMVKQTDQPLGAGERLGNQNRPTHILLPFDLESTFDQIDGAPWLPGSANNDANPHHKKYTPVYVRNWTDTDNWAMLAKYDGKSPIHLIWLQGRRTPELFEATDEMAASMFTNDELRYKVRQFGADFDATYPVAPVADWRNVHKSNV